MMFDNQTIFARATAVGKAGVAIIRISGQNSLKACEHFGFEGELISRKAYYHSFFCNNQHVDSGLIIYFKAPSSFTGEDCIEFQIHGGIAIQNYFIKELSKLENFRLAKPGEFSQRAFMNGKMDLVEAEGLVDLINADTERQRQQALSLTQGYASEFYHSLKHQVINSMALLEAFIDFPDEEIPQNIIDEVAININSLQEKINFQIKAGYSSEKLREGFKIVLIGEPNSGKSSLLNYFAKRDAAIVSPIAGTTRDLIEVNCDFKGFPVTLIDSAGIRNSSDLIESEGVKRALNQIKKSDVMLYLSDTGKFQLDTINDDIHIIKVCTKSDIHIPEGEYDYSISVQDPASIKLLENAICDMLEGLSPPSGAYALHLRHIKLLEQAEKSLEKSKDASLLEIKAEYLRQAASELEEIIGTNTVEELLGIIFSSFCIGK